MKSKGITLSECRDSAAFKLLLPKCLPRLASDILACENIIVLEILCNILTVKKSLCSKSPFFRSESPEVHETNQRLLSCGSGHVPNRILPCLHNLDHGCLQLAQCAELHKTRKLINRTICPSKFSPRRQYLFELRKISLVCRQYADHAYK
jgi:hypothetical protein